MQPFYILLYPNYNFTWNLGWVRIRSPYLKNSIGIGHKAKAIKASKELPHPSPSVAYILGPAKGRTAPKVDRKTVLAAIADAAYMVKASTKYIEMDI